MKISIRDAIMLLVLRVGIWIKLIAQSVFVVGVLVVCTAGTRASPSTRYSAVDLAIVDVIQNLAGADFASHIARVENLLRSVITSAGDGKMIKEADVSARLSLLDGFKQVRFADEHGEALSALRKLVDCLDLANSLQLSSESGIVEGSENLIKVRSGVWTELTKRGNGGLPFGHSLGSPNGVLVHREFSVVKEQIAAFELIGTPSDYRARWEERIIRRPQADSLQQVKALLAPNAANPSENRRWPLALVFTPKTERDAFLIEDELETSEAALADHGIAPILVATPDQRRPILRVPTVTTNLSDASAMENGASLIWTSSGQELWSSRRSTGISREAVKESTRVALALSTEISKALSEPLLSHDSLSTLLLRVINQASSDKRFSVKHSGTFLGLDGENVSVADDERLELEALTNNGWGRYRIKDSNTSVWIPLNNVQEARLTPKKEGSGKHMVPPSKKTTGNDAQVR